MVLLGQLLTQPTIQEESFIPVSLPLAANVLRVVGDDHVAVVDLPDRTGLSKEAIVMAVGNLNRRHLAAVNPDRSVRLTGEGLTALQAYHDSALRGSDGNDLRGALEGLLHSTEALAAGLRPPDGCWRSRKPHLPRTDRLLTDPTGSLPWHPMVLHRGGWPDGS